MVLHHVDDLPGDVERGVGGEGGVGWGGEGRVWVVRANVGGVGGVWVVRARCGWCGWVWVLLTLSRVGGCAPRG